MAIQVSVNDFGGWSGKTEEQIQDVRDHFRAVTQAYVDAAGVEEVQSTLEGVQDSEGTGVIPDH